MEFLKKLQAGRRESVTKQISVREILTKISDSKVGINEVIRYPKERETAKPPFMRPL